jgi:starvation-inducible outer membrane lipoprotein
MDMAVDQNEMAYPSASAQDEQVWQQLKQVIASSSGFKRWQNSRKLDEIDGSNSDRHNQDDMVRRYLRETLETLAY